MKYPSSAPAQDTVAFVLSGGGSIGAVQVGMIRALFARSVAPDVIVAASAGAFNGAFIASRTPTTDTADGLARVWSGLRRGDVFPFTPLTGLLSLAGARDHMVGAHGLRALVEKWVEFNTLEQAAIPFHVIATDLLNGAELRLSTGDAVSAVLGSAALPGVLPPVRREGRVLVDGGVTNNTPLSHAVELGAPRIYVLPTGFACALSEVPRGPVGVATQALGVLVHHRLVADIRQVPDGVELVVLPPLCPLGVSPADFSRTVELIDRSARSSGEYLDSIGPHPDHAVPELMRTAVHDHGRRRAA